MRVKVKLYATLSRYAPNKQAGAPFEVEIPEGATIQELANILKIPPEEARVAFVNAVIQPLDWALHPEDEIGLFPPIGGG